MSDADLAEPGTLAEPYVRTGPSGPGRQGSLLWLLVLALGLVGAAIALSIMRQEAAEPFVLALLAVFSVVGVVALFAAALGLMRLGEGAAVDLRGLVVDTMGEGILVAAEDGSVLYANAAYRNLTRSSGDSVPVSVDRAFAVYPEAAELIFRLVQAAREKRRWHEEFRVGGETGEDGGTWYRISVRPFEESDRRAADGASVVWRVAEVTYERERQENIYQELQAAIDYLDHAPAGFFSSNASGRIRYMNATLASWLGYDLAQMTDGSLNLSDIVSGDAAALLSQAVPLPGEVKTEILDLDLLRRDGTHLPVRLLHKVSFGADGKPHHSRTLVLNRSPGEDLSEDLRAAQVRFARFFNSAPIAIASIDRGGKVLRTNAAFARMQDSLGLAGGEQRLSGMVSDDDRGALEEALDLAGARQADIAPCDLILAGKEDRSIRLFMAPVDGAEGEEEAAIAYLIDTTEQRRLQAQFAQGQKMQAVGQLAGGIAHDFNNVLTAIIGYGDLLLASHRPTDPAFQDIMNIKQNANRAAGLVRQLLAFSRRQTLLPEVLQLTDAMGDLSVMLGRLLGEKIELKVEHGRDLWLVKADLIQLEQVIINLAVNARDAMSGGGQLKIRTSNVTAAEVGQFDYEGLTPGEYVLIEMADTGSGMTPEVMEKVFEPFFTTKDVGKGTGLGLSTVYGIVKQTGGFIYPESEIGKGTTFRIFLPRYEAGDEAAEAARAEAKAQEGARDGTQAGPQGADGADGAAPRAQEVAKTQDLTGQGTVLLVEDEDAVRAFSSRALSSRGYTVLEAPSGVEALELIDAHDGEIDLVVSDVVMPEMDGPTLLKELRKTHPDIKIIFMSGYAEEAFKRTLEGDEDFAFLPKPFNLKQLAAKVKEILET